MHTHEIKTDTDLVARLVVDQFPQWAGLPIKRVASAGTDNALYRLGDHFVVRLPRIHWAVDMVAKEQAWLPFLAPHLPLEIPHIVGCGEPGRGYPWPWTIHTWLPGEIGTLTRISDHQSAARTLAHFIRALQTIDAAGGPPPGSHNAGRGVPLTKRDAATRDALTELEGEIDTRTAAAVWQTALDAPEWDRPPVWLHGDLMAGNLLVQDGRLTAVIDFGCLGVGDPACDLAVAWNLFTPVMRKVFRQALAVDDDTWARGRGWALSIALIQLPYYKETNPTLAAISRNSIDQILAESPAVLH